jgi:hypothetical protein
MTSKYSFLEDLAAELYSQYRRDVAQLTLIFPSERVGRVFERCLDARLPNQAYSPEVLSLAQWMQQLSPLAKKQSLLLTYRLYESFKVFNPVEASFAQFYFWGNVLLEDFNVIDHHLVDAPHLFADISKYKALHLSHDYLTEAQKTAIKSFWKHFEHRLSTHQQRFMHLWQVLPQVYQHFTRRLQSQGIGYPGLCYRAAYEILLKDTRVASQDRLIFAGLNALTPVEEKVIAWHQARTTTAFYWDVDAYYMEDEQQEAGLYLRKYRQSVHFQASFASTLPRRIAADNQTVQVTEVASEVGQVDVLKAQLEDLIEQQGSDFVPHKTVVVVANEALYWPVWHALSSMQEISVSTNLGYALKNTITYRLLEHLLTLHISTTQQNLSEGCFPIARVLCVLQHPYVMGWNPVHVQTTIDHLQGIKCGYISQEELARMHVFYARLFKRVAPSAPLLHRLIEGLQCIEAYTPEAMLRPLEKIALQQLLQQLDRLRVLLATSPPQQEALLELLRQLVQPIQLPLGDQSLTGVQILDVPATQNLDFDNVFIVGMNEGHFPRQTSTPSLIPYNLRKGYDLPTVDQHQNALYAYYFYRLLQRAKAVHITYSTQVTSEVQGEMSRYLLQLRYASPIRVDRQAITHPTHLASVHPIVIAKRDAVWQRLQKFLLSTQGTAQPLTPSALNTYIDCSLRFYFQYIAQIQTPTSPLEVTHASVFGHLLHKVMEALYTPLMTNNVGKLLQETDFVALQKEVPNLIKTVFDSTFPPHVSANSQGDHALAQEVMTKLVRKIVRLDQAYVPFVLVGLEMGRKSPLYIDFAVDASNYVRLRGIIDRVDWKSGVVRVLDYKTGTDTKHMRSVASLFDRAVAKRNKAAFQTLFYTWLWHQQDTARMASLHQVAFVPSTDLGKERVMPVLLNTRQLFDARFDPRFFIQVDNGRTYHPIDDIATHLEEWEEGLRATLTELLDPAVPFSQTDDVARCTTCPYKGICMRY